MHFLELAAFGILIGARIVGIKHRLLDWFGAAFAVIFLIKMASNFWQFASKFLQFVSEGKFNQSMLSIATARARSLTGRVPVLARP